MKHLFKLLILLTASCLSFASCSSDNDVIDDGGKTPTVTDTLRNYTVMLYGCGGGNLDEALNYNLQQAEEYGYSDSTQFVAKVKYSESYQEIDANKYGGTRCYTLTKNGMTNQQVDDVNFRMDDPANIAAFIKETKAKYPAKHYILVFWNHGSTFDIRDQPVSDSYNTSTRSLVFDDNNNENISIFELEEGLKRSETKMDMVYFDVCQMNMIENLYQIKDYTHYVLGAAHLTPSIGGNYAQLLTSLDNHADVKSAMQEFVPAMGAIWKESLGTSTAMDLTLSDMDHIDEVVNIMKTYTEKLCNYQSTLTVGSQEELNYYCYNSTSVAGEEKEQFHSNDGLLYFFDNTKRGCSPSIDLYSFATRMANNLILGDLSVLAMKLKSALGKMITVSSSCGLPDFMNNVSVGIYWNSANSYQYEYEDPKYTVNSMKKLYPMLAFDKVVHWSKFLEGNNWKSVKLMYWYEIDYYSAMYYYESESPLLDWSYSFEFTTAGDLSDEEIVSISNKINYVFPLFRLNNEPRPVNVAQLYFNDRMVPELKSCIAYILESYKHTQPIGIKVDLHAEGADEISEVLTFD